MHPDTTCSISIIPETLNKRKKHVNAVKKSDFPLILYQSSYKKKFLPIFMVVQLFFLKIKSEKR